LTIEKLKTQLDLSSKGHLDINQVSRPLLVVGLLWKTNDFVGNAQEKGANSSLLKASQTILFQFAQTDHEQASSTAIRAIGSLDSFITFFRKKRNEQNEREEKRREEKRREEKRREEINLIQCFYAIRKSWTTKARDFSNGRFPRID